MDNFDTIIIGSGPAGISAAIYLKRYNLNPLIISNGKTSLSKATIENYYGIDSISGEDLYNNGINQAKRLGISIIEAEVLSIDPFDSMNVKTTKGEYKGKTLFLGLGKSRNKLLVKNANNLLGKGISMCATCDGFFFRNKTIGILGAGRFMEEELEVLKRFTPNITIFTNGDCYTSESFPVVMDKVIEAKGEEKLEAIITENGEYKLDGLFVALGEADGADFANHIGIELDDKKNIVVNKDYMTNVKGVFAGGDCIGGMLQVCKAVSDGAQAALAIKNYLPLKK